MPADLKSADDWQNYLPCQVSNVSLGSIKIDQIYSNVTKAMVKSLLLVIARNTYQYSALASYPLFIPAYFDTCLNLSVQTPPSSPTGDSVADLNLEYLQAAIISVTITHCQSMQAHAVALICGHRQLEVSRKRS